MRPVSDTHGNTAVALSAASQARPAHIHSTELPSPEVPWFNSSSLRARALPPMLQQYVEYKQRFPECIVLFQVGDFYEIFFDDAVTVSRTINLTLTSRDKSSDAPIPMCGVPIHNVEGYLERLVDAGLSCAVVSQLLAGDDPAAKNGVPRKLTRIVTPGVRILSSTEGKDGASICAAVALHGTDDSPDATCAIATTDVRSGEIIVSEDISRGRLMATLQALAPREVLLPKSDSERTLDRRQSWVRALESGLEGAVCRFRAGMLTGGVHATTSQNGRSREFSALAGFSALSPLTKRAVCGLLEYIDETTVEGHVRFHAVVRRAHKSVMRIDATTRRNLELIRNVREGSSAGTLFSCLQHTVSEPGTRLLREWIQEPLIEVDAIRARHDAVAWLLEHSEARNEIRALLQGVSDVERTVTRLELSAAGPREIAAVRETVRIARALKELMTTLPAFSDSGDNGKGDSAKGDRGLVHQTLLDIPPLEVLAEYLERALAEQVPWLLSEGGVIRSGFDAELDRIRELKNNSSTWMAEFEQTERARTGINSLKVRSNSVLGFFIEITRANVTRVPSDYLRRQSTAQAERFTTDALRNAEREFLSAASKESERERTLFRALLDEVRPWEEALRLMARCLATLDVLSGLSVAAERNRWVRPQIDESLEMQITEGRHPIISSMLAERFVPNDLTFNQNARRLLILTGPNMGGKSTYLRQTALIAIMAQLGSFVPAAQARIGVIDQVFARMGASDNLSEGESTFMVEMREMAHILGNATSRSLLLIDEVGRGTATADGVALAHAIVEWLVSKINARTLFATHFHELTALAAQSERIANISVTSLEQGEEVVFTHHIAEGAASRSYGVEVAKLAGIPGPVRSRAIELMRRMSMSAQGVATSQLSLFEVQPPVVNTVKPEDSADAEKYRALAARIEEIDVNHTTPLEALEMLHALQKAL